MKMAKASKADIYALQTFFMTLERAVEEDSPDEVIARYVKMAMNGRVGSAHNRVTIGCDMLIDNCCDPDKTHLDWKPEIKKLMPETQNEQGERLFYIISYKNSEKGVLTFWGPDNGGYTTNIRRAGKYPESKVRAMMDYYHQGESAVAISVEEVHSNKFKISENVWANGEKQAHLERVKLGVLVDETLEKTPDTV